MINHARTLLLNVAGPRTGSPGEEYIPPLFQPVTLPACLQTVRRVLFGASPDRTMLNVRGRQLLMVLHATELVQYVLDLDPRITYVLGDDRLFSGVFGARVIAGDPETLFPVGELGAPDDTGTAEHRWSIHVLDGSRVRVRRTCRPAANETYDYTVAAGLSDLVRLPGSSLRFRFRPVPGRRWTIAGYARPTSDLGRLTATLRAMGEAVSVELFGIGTPRAKTEPFLTFLNLWQRHHEMPYQLGGLLLALIYRTDELRQA